jgi:hypothetical protein
MGISAEFFDNDNASFVIRWTLVVWVKVTEPKMGVSTGLNPCCLDKSHRTRDWTFQIYFGISHFHFKSWNLSFTINISWEWNCLTDLSTLLKVAWTELTIIDNLQHLLRLLFFDKTGFAAFHFQWNKETTMNWFLPDREKTRVIMTLIHLSPSSTTIVAKCSPQNWQC